MVRVIRKKYFINHNYNRGIIPKNRRNRDFFKKPDEVTEMQYLFESHLH